MSDAALIDRFLEMMAAERGASRNTLAAYRRDLEQAAEWVKGPLGDADAAALRKLMADYRSLAASSAARKLSALRQFFDVVVVDTASRPDEHLLAALDQADVVLVVCTPEIASLKNAARFLALAHELGYGDEKLKLTINRLSSHGSIPLKDIESNLRHKMAFGLPSDGIPVIEALNAGEPVVLMRPSARIAREIRSVAGELVSLFGFGDDGLASGAPAPRGGVFRRLGRRRAS